MWLWATAIYSEGCSTCLLNVRAPCDTKQWTYHLCPSCWLYAVVRTTAHPWAVDGLIGWKIAIRVLLWRHIEIERHGCSIDPLGIQRGRPSSPPVTWPRRASRQEVTFHPFLPQQEISLYRGFLHGDQGCVDVDRFNYGYCVSGQGHFEVGGGLGLILVGFIAVA